MTRHCLYFFFYTIGLPAHSIPDADVLEGATDLTNTNG